MSDNNLRFTSTNDVGRALYAELDDLIRARAERKAKDTAARIKLLTFGLVQLSEAKVAELTASYKHQLYSAVFASEAGRMYDIVHRAENAL